jgi:Arc/MetJ-type ribon-helix-helix transcriptional regulator
MNQFSPMIERIVREKMATGKYATEDELLLDALQSLEAEDEELRAIQEGIDSVDRGEEGILLHDAFKQLRAEHGIPESA